MTLINMMYNNMARKYKDINHIVLRQNMKAINDIFGRHHFLIEDETEDGTRTLKYAHQDYQKYNSSYDHITDHPEERKILKANMTRLCNKIHKCIENYNVRVIV
jgi:hypothetical protein